MFSKIYKDLHLDTEAERTHSTRECRASILNPGNAPMDTQPAEPEWATKLRAAGYDVIVGTAETLPEPEYVMPPRVSVLRRVITALMRRL